MKRLLLAAVAAATLAGPVVSSAQDAAQDRGGVGQIRRGVPNPDRSVTNTQRQEQSERQQDRQRQQRQQDRDARDRFDRYDRFDRDDRFGRTDRFDDRRGWSRNDPNWWRGRPEFRGYTGPRAGFWFFPNYGYIRPEPRFYGYSWRRGDLVPQAYWRYTVVDPYLYGLGWPPPGAQWVYLGRDIVLMDVRTGRIRDVVVGAF